MIQDVPASDWRPRFSQWLQDEPVPFEKDGHALVNDVDTAAVAAVAAAADADFAAAAAADCCREPVSDDYPSDSYHPQPQKEEASIHHCQRMSLQKAE